MKVYKIFFVMAVLAITFISCDDDDDAKFVPQVVKNAFLQQFSPNNRVEWEVKSVGYVAEFVNNGQKTTAWFEHSGGLMMTEVNISYPALPEAVKATFEQSKYAKWRKEDVEKVIRPAVETLYIIEVESGDTEVDLYYSETGILVKEVVDIDNDNDDRFESLLPQQMPTQINEFITQKYPNAKIVELDIERNGVIQVDILDGSISREISFSSQYDWLQTSWDVRYLQLPQSVKDVISQQSGYEFDDADYVEAPTNSYYKIELDGLKDKTIKVKEDGTML